MINTGKCEEYYLGDEWAVNKLVNEDAPLAEKIIGKLGGMLKKLSGKTDAGSREDRKRLRKALELYEKAVSKSDKLDNKEIRKLLADLRDEEEEEIRITDGSYDGENNENEALTNTNGQNVKVREGVDSEERIEYNRKKTKYIPYNRIGAIRIDAIRKELIRIYSGLTDGIADDLAIAIEKTIYIVDSGKEKGKIDFGVKKKFVISDDLKRENYIRRINQESYDNGYGDRELFEKLGVNVDNDSRSDVGRVRRSNNTAYSRKSSDNQGRVFGKDGHRGIRILRDSEKANSETEYSRKSSSDTVTMSKGELQKRRANYDNEKVYKL